MSQSFTINFTYQSPCEDMELLKGINPDNSLNIKYTLISQRNMLQHNIDLLNKLIDNCNVISNLASTEYNTVRIEIDSPLHAKELVELDIIKKLSNDNDSENETDNIDFFDQNQETNQDRLAMINNLVNQNDNNSIFDDTCDSDSLDNSSNSDPGTIDDEDNIKLLISKYTAIMKLQRKLDESDESDESCDSDSSEFNDTITNEDYVRNNM